MNNHQTQNKNQNYNEIVDNLFLGNKNAAESHSDLFSLIINCSKDIPFSKQCKQGIRIPINDDPGEVINLLNYMKNTTILEQIHTTRTNKQPVLIHCFAGMQRSCAVVACYLIKYYRAPPLLAINFIKRKRNEAFFGGINFIRTLEMFYGSLQ